VTMCAMRLTPLVVTVACTLAAAGPAAAQGPPAVSTGSPTVDGDYVTLSGSVTSTDDCALLGNNCPANYVISAAPLPPTAGYVTGSLYWSNQPQPQSMPLIINMRTVTQAFKFPRGATTYTVALGAVWAPSQVVYGSTQTFTWPAGRLRLAGVDLLPGSARLAYRLAPGRTAFRSGSVKATVRSLGGRRLGSLRDHAEPGQNLVSLPPRLAKRLVHGSRYRVGLRARDDFGRTARTRGVVRF
jgi:hypothetical protein